MNTTIQTLALLLVIVFSGSFDSFAQMTDELENLRNNLNELSSPSPQDAQRAVLAIERQCFDSTAPGREVYRAALSKLIGNHIQRSVAGQSISKSTSLFLLRQLERIGGPESVDVLSGLLTSDEDHIREGARRALTVNPAPAATTSLQRALAKASDDQVRVGLINSLGQRGDATSVAELTKQLEAAAPEIFDAIINSLAQIDSPDSLSAIEAAHRGATAKKLKTTGDALLRCADRMSKQGSTESAHEMYMKIRNTVKHSSARLAAIHGQIATAGEKSADLILGILASDDRQARQVATGFVSELPESSLPGLLAGIDKLPTPSQSQLIVVLGNRRASLAIEVVRNGIQNETPEIRAACLTALGNIGNADDVDRLFKVMRTSETDRSVAQESLGRLRNDRVNGILIDKLASAESDDERLDCISVLNHRRAESAVPELLKQAGSNNVEVRRRAVNSLGRLASANDVTDLLRIHGASSREERDSIEKAIVSVCQRIGSLEGKADPLLKSYETASPEARVRILQVLGRIGGSNAKQEIERALSSQDTDLYDAAVDAFANWPDGSVSDQLLEIARKGRSQAHQIRALRSLARVCVLPTPEREDLQRLEFLEQAMKLATRNDEIDLILDRAKAVRTVETLRFVAPFLDDPQHQKRAIQTVLAIAHHRDVREPNRVEFVPALKKILRVTDDPKFIEKATQYLENR